MVLELLQSLDVPLPFTIAISILSLPADVLLESYHIHLTAPSLAPSTSLASEVSAFVATLPDYKFSTTPGVYLRLGLASAPPPATSIPLASTPGLSVVRAPPLLARQTEALEPGQRVFASRDASAAKLTIKTYVRAKPAQRRARPPQRPSRTPRLRQKRVRWGARAKKSETNCGRSG
jgi:hypothetical protein